MGDFLLGSLGSFGAEAHAGAEVFELARANVGGHDDDGVLEIDLATHAVGELTFVKDLQQNVIDIVVRFLDFVQQHDRVGLAAHLFGELAALFVTDIARRRADEAGNRVFLHVLAHVDADDSVLGVKEILCQHFGKIGFADTGGTEEDESADGLVRVFQTGAVAAYGLGDFHHRFVLTDDHPLQFCSHAHQSFTFVLGDALHGYARHHRNYLSHSVLRDIGTVLVNAVLPGLLNQLAFLLQHLDLVAVFGGLVVLLVADGLHFQLLLFRDGSLCGHQLVGHVDVLDVQSCTGLVHHVDGFVGKTTV